MMTELFITAFIIGLMGAGHCLGMCGGITAALSFALPSGTSWSKKLAYLLAYNLGRITSYLAVGVVVGLLGMQIKSVDAFLGFSLLRLVAGIMLVLMGLYVSGWWKVLNRVERVGSVLWSQIQPTSAKFLPVKNATHALAVGALWGWLPCGLVYSTLFFALAQADLMASSLVMLAFGLGTMPALLVGGLAGERLKALLGSVSLRVFMGVLLVGFGLWTVYGARAHSHDAHHPHHPHHASLHASSSALPFL